MCIRDSFKVIRHVRPKLACCRCDTIVQAPAASRPIMNGLAGPGLLAHVLTAKYCDHLPLYRQSGIYARSGVDLERSTLADWVGQCSTLLRPLVREARAGPLLDNLQAWLTETLTKISQKSALAEAIRYALTRWTALTLSLIHI